MKRAYPLQTLLQLKQQNCEARMATLGLTQSALAQAERELEALRTERTREQQRASSVADVEAARLDSGEARAVDLAWHHEFQLAAAVQLARATEGERRASGTARAASEQLTLAQRDLAQAEADRRAFEQHRANWQRRLERADEQDLEEAAQDAAAVRAARRAEK